jgi:hypothetical protein
MSRNIIFVLMYHRYRLLELYRYYHLKVNFAAVSFVPLL